MKRTINQKGINFIARMISENIDEMDDFWEREDESGVEGADGNPEDRIENSLSRASWFIPSSPWSARPEYEEIEQEIRLVERLVPLTLSNAKGRLKLDPISSCPIMYNDLYCRVDWRNGQENINYGGYMVLLFHNTDLLYDILSQSHRIIRRNCDISDRCAVDVLQTVGITERLHRASVDDVFEGYDLDESDEAMDLMNLEGGDMRGVVILRIDDAAFSDLFDVDMHYNNIRSQF
jgi:hypothetical protein